MRRDILIALALFTVGLWQNLSHVDSTKFHRDEARWVHRARFVQELADPLGSYWHDRELTRGQPPFGSYLTGIGLIAQGRDLDTNDLWDFNFSKPWNLRHGRMPSFNDLAAARRTNAVIGALTAVAVYFIGCRLANRVAGVAAALLLIPHPLSIYLPSLAGSDAALGLLIALAALAATTLAGRPTWPRAVLLGILLGLGGATKLSPLLISLPLAAVGLVLLCRAWRRPATADADHASALGWRLLSLPAVAFATFVVVYPYLWPDPVGRTLTLFQFRAREMANQGEVWEDLAVTSRADALGRIGHWLGEVHSTTGRLAGGVAARVGVDWSPTGIDLPLALIGAQILVLLVVRHGLGSRHALAAVVLGAQVAAIVLGMRADFQRYLLPVVITEAVCVGMLAGQAWTVASALAERRAGRRVDPAASFARELPRQTAQA